YGGAVWVGELPGLPVELPAGKSKTTALGFGRWSGASFLEPSQYRTHAREQFAQIERLRQIVVGSELKPDDPVNIVTAVAGNDDNPDVGNPAGRPQQNPTVRLPAAKIEDHEIHLGATEFTDHLPPVRRH